MRPNSLIYAAKDVERMKKRLLLQDYADHVALNHAHQHEQDVMLMKQKYCLNLPAQAQGEEMVLNLRLTMRKEMMSIVVRNMKGLPCQPTIIGDICIMVADVQEDHQFNCNPGVH